MIRQFAEAALRFGVRAIPDGNLHQRGAYWAARGLQRYPGRRQLREATIWGGARLLIDLSDHDGRMIYLRGVYEPEVSAFAQSVIRYGDTVLDVGANVGAHTILFASLVGRAGRVHAFEPFPPAAQRLRSSIGLNGWETRVEVHELALSNVDGWVDLRPDGISGNTSSVVSLPWLSAVPPITVQATTLDAMAFEFSKRARLCKIDVEGAELLVLAGGAERFFHDIPPEYLVVEFWSYGDPKSLLRTIESLGYKLIDPPRGTGSIDETLSTSPDIPLWEPAFTYTNLFFRHSQ